MTQVQAIYDDHDLFILRKDSEEPFQDVAMHSESGWTRLGSPLVTPDSRFEIVGQRLRDLRRPCQNLAEDI